MARARDQANDLVRVHNISRRHVSRSFILPSVLMLSLLSPSDGGAADTKPTRGKQRLMSRSGSTKEARPRVDNLWQSLPPTPTLPPLTIRSSVPVDGVNLFCGEMGAGPTVIFLHGGAANSDYWSQQFSDLADIFRVIVMDTRGHGRSTLSSEPLTYGRLALDVVQMMDARKIEKAHIVGWSDGAITGLELAMRYKERISSLYLFGANFNPNGLIKGGAKAPVFASYIARARKEYEALSDTPDGWNRLYQKLISLWQSGPNFTRTQLESIRCPVAVLGAEHDEIIQRSHTLELAKLVGATTAVIEPGVSHFAFLQKPHQFSQRLRIFLRV